MATFTTYDQIGKSEDVSDVITNITPTDTRLLLQFVPRRSTLEYLNFKKIL